MKVVVNSEEFSVEDGDSVARALERLQIETVAGTAVAVNRRVVPRDQWDAHVLESGAEIVVLKATQGG